MNWRGTLIGTMKQKGIKSKDVAKHLGVSPGYISYIINGKKTAKTGKGSKQSLFNAIKEIEKCRTKQQ